MTSRASAEQFSPAPAEAGTPPFRGYLELLLLAAVIALPIGLAAWAFLQGVDRLQTAVWETWPQDRGYSSPPWWWVTIALLFAGAVVGLTIAYLPGRGGHLPVEGFSAQATQSRDLPGILIAGAASIALGAVVGPEGPLIGLGGGLGVGAMWIVRRNAAEPLVRLAALTGTAVAVSTIFGSPVIGAVLVLEILGVSGMAKSTVLLPALLGAGIGGLMFTGLDSWAGVNTSSLVLPALPTAPRPSGVDVLWAIAIGLGAALLIFVVKSLGREVAPRAVLQPEIATPIAGLAVALCAIVFSGVTDHGVEEVVLSGENSIGPLVSQSESWPTKALLLLILLKGIAYGVSLGSFRGGPTFPALYLGAAAGLVLADQTGLTETQAVAMAMGAMTCAVLMLPLFSVVLVEVFMSKSGFGTSSLVIVAVVVAFVATSVLNKLHPRSANEENTDPTPPPTADGVDQAG